MILANEIQQPAIYENGSPDPIAEIIVESVCELKQGTSVLPLLDMVKKKPEYSFSTKLLMVLPGETEAFEVTLEYQPYLLNDRICTFFLSGKRPGKSSIDGYIAVAMKKLLKFPEGSIVEFDLVG
ncbi:MAG TPA: hypothetical protein PKJ26_04295 [Candidatus Woesebacteria bacterium]|nr:hypothetical protein [Candidatus Woesebacteria bacterium]HNS65688.1 hypothetical protein [Candidatus Woesebacteria bacterium]